MGIEWFVKNGEKTLGPFDSAKLKQFASAGKISRSTQVSRSSAGPWTHAGNVKGLFEAVLQKSSAPTAAAPVSSPPPVLPSQPVPAEKGFRRTVVTPTAIFGVLAAVIALAVVTGLWRHLGSSGGGAAVQVAVAEGASQNAKAIAPANATQPTEPKKASSDAEPTKASSDAEPPKTSSEENPAVSQQSIAAKDPKGWNKARFGMTETEVADAVGDKVKKATKPEDYGETQATLAIDDMEIAGSRYDVLFLFGKKSNKLEHVMMKFDGTPSASECQTLVALLTEKYGKPDLDAIKSNGRERDVEWHFPTTKIGVTLFELPGLGPLMRLGYQPMAGKPEDPKDAL